MAVLVHKLLEGETAVPIKTVYLAGPLTGLTYRDARHGWREEFAKMLPAHILPLSPMRGKDSLMGEVDIQGDPDMYPSNALCSASGIVTRDRNDVKNCDVMVACFLGMTERKSSIGTCVEFGWADAYRKPVIMVIEDDPNGSYTDSDGITRTIVNSGKKANIHLHAFLTEIAGYRVNNLEEAAEIVRCLLAPGV